MAQASRFSELSSASSTNNEVGANCSNYAGYKDTRKKVSYIDAPASKNVPKNFPFIEQKIAYFF